MITLRVSFGLSFESMKSTTSLRPATPPALLITFVAALTPLTADLKTPGAIELSTSATTAMLIEVGVTPTSLAVFAAARGVTAPVGRTSAATTPLAIAPTTHARQILFTFPPAVSAVGSRGWASIRPRHPD